MEKLKIGVIGVGTMGIKHLNVFATMAETTVVGIADLNLEVAQKAAAQYSGDIKCYTDYHKMIGELKPDAVVISLPDSMHRDPVVAALAAGAHVMVEKPLATTLEDANYLIDFAKKCGKTLMVNYSHRWVPAYYKAWETIRSGKVGQVAMVYTKKDDPITVPKRWPWLAESTPSAFLSSHDIDLTRWYIGCEAKSVYARGFKKVVKEELNMDTYDCIQALVEFENGAFATFESCWIYPETFPVLCDSYIQVTCEHGVIQIPRQSENLEIATDESYSYPRLGISPMIEGKVQGAFRICHEHFIDCILNNKEPMTSGAEARQVAEIVEAIHRSLKSGEVVRLPLDERISV